MSLDRPWDHMEFPYFVELYYSTDHPDSKKAGRLAIATKHKSERSRDVEIQAGHSREDIGKILWGMR